MACLDIISSNDALREFISEMFEHPNELLPPSPSRHFTLPFIRGGWKVKSESKKVPSDVSICRQAFRAGISLSLVGVKLGNCSRRPDDA